MDLHSHSLAWRWFERARLLGVLAGAALSPGCLKAPDRYAQSTLDVKLNPPATFEVDGKPFCFAGTNNYYPIFKPKPVVDDLFDAARALNLKVMRVWGMLDRGSLDGSVPNTDGPGERQGVYFQYWDPARRRPAYNDGENGLQRLDYVLAAAAKNDIKVIVVLVNNWRAFGGIDQYLTWYGRNKHHEFFTAPEVKQAYRDWVKHVITRTSSVTAVKYAEDPTVFAWELANEPRCKGGNAFDTATGWDKSTITDWAAEMSGYIKSLDPNHLVSVGDEGFLDGGGDHWTYEAKDGVDHAALTALPHIDFGTFHLYPEDWGTPENFGERWIIDHLKVARELDKPTMLEEYGLKVNRTQGNLGDVSEGWVQRRDTYRRWNEIMLERGGNAALPWMLAGIDEDKPRYPDYDKFVFYRDDETGKLIGDYGARFLTAPACQVHTASSTSGASPFVRVRRRPERVALGWIEDDRPAL
ncbi:MAG TPA: cellulase family glycosylhydrolase [Polyangiaceae bacterium]|nr:cellulase family glycosylhydrolase [Polyangiaceae bacterium]